MSKAKEDVVNKPKHYFSPYPIRMEFETGQGIGNQEGYIQALDVIKAWGLNFHLGNVIKYILRSGKKGNDPAKWIEDLKKARYYLDDEIKVLESKLGVK